MNNLRTRTWIRSISAVAVVLVAFLLIYWWTTPNRLEFRELSSPAGYRALVLNRGTSRSNSVLDIVPAKPSSKEEVSDPDLNDVGLCTALLEDETSPLFGDPDAVLSIVAFLDIRCPYCRTLSEILTRLHDLNGVRVIYKDWPILGEGSRLGARAALAAARQGRYLDFHFSLMQSVFIPTHGYVRDLSSRLGLDHAKLEIDMASAQTSAALDRNAALARRFGLIGTPVLIVGRTVVEGAISEKTLMQLVKEEMSQGKLCQ